MKAAERGISCSPLLNSLWIEKILHKTRPDQVAVDLSLPLQQSEMHYLNLQKQTIIVIHSQPNAS
jgi:hypothetical protein